MRGERGRAVLKGGTYVPIMRQRRYGDQSGMADEGDDGGEACDGTEKDVTDRRAISADAARALRGDLKGALTGFANGRGSVEALLHEIERIAKYVTGCPDIALGPAREAMRRLVRSDAPARLADTGLPGVEWDEQQLGRAPSPRLASPKFHDDRRSMGLPVEAFSKAIDTLSLTGMRPGNRLPREGGRAGGGCRRDFEIEPPPGGDSGIADDAPRW